MRTLVGEFVLSLSGHDKGSTYLVVGEEERCVLLSDGRLRRLSKPKRKNKKHILSLNVERVENVAALTDGALRQKIRHCGEESVS